MGKWTRMGWERPFSSHSVSRKPGSRSSVGVAVSAEVVDLSAASGGAEAEYPSAVGVVESIGKRMRIPTMQRGILFIYGLIGKRRGSVEIDTMCVSIWQSACLAWGIVGYSSVCPPFTESFCPVMKLASSEARKVTAAPMSDGTPMRFIGTCWV